MATQSIPPCCSSEANDLALQIAEAATGHTEVIAIDGYVTFMRISHKISVFTTYPWITRHQSVLNDDLLVSIKFTQLSKLLTYTIW